MIGVIKNNDKRYSEMVNYFKDVIYSDKLSDFKDISVLILPLKGVDSYLFIDETNLNVMDFYIKDGPKLIITGFYNDELKNFCLNEGIKLVSYLEDEEYTWQNSLLTAECFLKKLNFDLDESLNDKSILITGYGYQAKALYYYLKVFTNNIAIYATDYHDKKHLFCENINISDLSHLNYDIIINTIPHNIINDTILIKDNTLIYDLASYPYGFSDQVRQTIPITILPKMPSLYLPKSAGKNLANWVLNLLKSS